MPFVFGLDAPCRHCHGAGQRVVAMTPQEQREHDRENRRRRANGEETQRAPLTKTCPDCAGAGYVPVAEADRSTI